MLHTLALLYFLCKICLFYQRKIGNWWITNKKNDLHQEELDSFYDLLFIFLIYDQLIMLPWNEYTGFKSYVWIIWSIKACQDTSKTHFTLDKMPSKRDLQMHAIARWLWHSFSMPASKYILLWFHGCVGKS